MSNNTVYILNKQFGKIPAGKEFELSSNTGFGKVYYERTGSIDVLIPADFVENNPEWFSIKKEDKVKEDLLFDIQHRKNWLMFVYDGLTNNMLIDIFNEAANLAKMLGKDGYSPEQCIDRITYYVSAIINKNESMISHYNDFFDSPKKYTEKDMEQCFIQAREFDLPFSMNHTYFIKEILSDHAKIKSFGEFLKELTDKK